LLSTGCVSNSRTRVTLYIGINDGFPASNILIFCRDTRQWLWATVVPNIK
jgi:hypothetical protein